MIIDVTIKNRSIECEQEIIGKENENRATVLQIFYDDAVKNKEVYLEFQKADGTKYVSNAIEVNTLPSFETITYYSLFEIPNTLLNVSGVLMMEIVLRGEDNFVSKTYTHKFMVIKSINASETIKEENPDFISEAQSTLNAMKDLVNTTGDGTKYLSDDGTYKEVVGGASDYNTLENKPLEVISNLSMNTPKYLNELTSGAYLLHGYFKPNASINKWIVAQVPLFTTVTVSQGTSYIQLFFSYNNQIQYLVIKDTEYTMQSISISDLLNRIETLESKVA